jgi:hypothetical protein
MTSRSSCGFAVAALLLPACTLGVEGLGPDLVDDAGSPPLVAVDASPPEAASPPVDAMTSEPTDAARVSIDARGVANANDASGGSHEGGSCVLPSGATLCCGSVACTDGDGTCATAGVCDLCEAKCTDPAKPVCCARSSKEVACAATPAGC